MHNNTTPNLNWYYSYIKIEPLWRDDNILAFRANLPLTDRHVYLRYRLRSWPIPGNTTEFRMQLQVPNDIAFHTETGGIFKPTSCLGDNPAICRTGPIFYRTMMKCSRGILTGDPQLRRQCYVTITKVRERINTVQEISPGVAIISTYFSPLCQPGRGKSTPNWWTLSFNDTIKLPHKRCRLESCRTHTSEYSIYYKITGYKDSPFQFINDSFPRLRDSTSERPSLDAS